MAAATLDDLERIIAQARAINDSLEKRNAEEFTWLDRQFKEINELLLKAGQKTAEAKKRAR